MNYSIKHLFHIEASIHKVFEAIQTIEGLSNWWTTQTKGASEINDTIQFDFGDTVGPKMKIIQLEKEAKIVWECIESNHGWIGHRFVFLLDNNEGKTRLRFSHDGWKEQDDFYGICSFSWGRYLESLRQYCQTGKGEAHGSEGYRK
ncbi:SRPBCC domain-containing protein [Aquimarina sp. 2201CG5-10]|uniref:SRPBCC family protein n=1 Tax=Aquimarina callyspongiae TaxID=3098150 RepID=UPI002AB3DF2A|nr:SRPBCC domain-containing protein [Aquimarina sp. 2201CG5-10]MDY8137792.1 SRPBCC domain-containing protein [Aquimarina sp. 2201CG5-10]